MVTPMLNQRPGTQIAAEAHLRVDAQHISPLPLVVIRHVHLRKERKKENVLGVD